MLRRATIAVSAPNTLLWEQERAERVLENLDGAVDRALPRWINKLLAAESNKTKVFKIIRAHRRGLLHEDRPQRWGYPKNWKEIANNIRRLDGFSCVACSATNCELHVHHLVYASNFGTHQKSNLVTLCRECHEKEHKRVLDFGEDLSKEDAAQWVTDQRNEELIEKGISRAIELVEDGVGEFSEYADSMVDSLGPDIKPYLLSFWEGMRHSPEVDASMMTDVPESLIAFQAITGATDSSAKDGRSAEDLPSNTCDSVTVVISRDDIITKDISSTLGFLKELIKTPETARQYCDRVDFVIDGFNETSEELCEISAVRDFIHAVDEEFPYWLFFLDKSALGLQCVVHCFLAPYLSKQGKKTHHPKQIEQLLLTRWFPALNEICEWVGFSESQVEKITERSIDYLIEGPSSEETAATI